MSDRIDQSCEVEFEGSFVSPLAHVAMHAAVKGQIEEMPEVNRELLRASP